MEKLNLSKDEEQTPYYVAGYLVFSLKQNLRTSTSEPDPLVALLDSWGSRQNCSLMQPFRKKIRRFQICKLSHLFKRNQPPSIQKVQHLTNQQNQTKLSSPIQKDQTMSEEYMLPFKKKSSSNENSTFPFPLEPSLLITSAASPLESKATRPINSFSSTQQEQSHHSAAPK
eukprot:TCONS_00056236-protein